MVAKAKVSALVSDQESPVLRAAELVTALLKHTRTRSLADLFSQVDAGEPAVLSKLSLVALSEDQVDLIEVHGSHLQYVRNLPTVGLSECPECASVAVVAGVVPRACTLTLGCEGNPIKSSAARKVAAPDQEPRP